MNYCFIPMKTVSNTMTYSCWTSPKSTELLFWRTINSGITRNSILLTAPSQKTTESNMAAEFKKITTSKSWRMVSKSSTTLNSVIPGVCVFLLNKFDFTTVIFKKSWLFTKMTLMSMTGFRRAMKTLNKFPQQISKGFSSFNSTFILDFVSPAISDFRPKSTFWARIKDFRCPGIPL